MVVELRVRVNDGGAYQMVALVEAVRVVGAAVFDPVPEELSVFLWWWSLWM